MPKSGYSDISLELGKSNGFIPWREKYDNMELVKIYGKTKQENKKSIEQKQQKYNPIHASWDGKWKCCCDNTISCYLCVYFAETTHIG